LPSSWTSLVCSGGVAAPPGRTEPEQWRFADQDIHQTASLLLPSVSAGSAPGLAVPNNDSLPDSRTPPVCFLENVR